MTTPSATLPRQPQTVFRNLRVQHVLLIGVVLSALFLRLYHIETIGNGNTYYTAAVKSMLQSPSNFFFVVAEPGASVTVDKPPLGLWIQAISAFIFGISGFSVTLPQIIAGSLSTAVLYVLVARHTNRWCGLLAGFVMAISPVSVAVDRNNTMDAQLIFVLLLSAWAFLLATENGKLRYILLGGLLVGLGFNIKMLQAFLPLPAFFALYFFGSQHPWGRKLLHLGACAVVIIVVSLSWAIAVDLVPANARPFIGSSENNTVMDLIFGYNGVQRLSGENNSGIAFPLGGSTTGLPANIGLPPQGTTPPASTNGFQPPVGQQPNTSTLPNVQPPFGGAGGGMNPFPMGGNNPMQAEVGERSITRLLSLPLANEVSWLLPFALFSVVLILLSEPLRFQNISSTQKGMLLWGGWLLICTVFFSIASFFHAYYLAMFSPAIGGMLAIGTYRLWQLYQRNPINTFLLTLLVALFTLLLQALVVGAYGVPWSIALVSFALMMLACLGAIVLRGQNNLWMAHGAFCAVIVAMLFLPLLWAFATANDDSPNVTLPHAYSGQVEAFGRGGGMNPLIQTTDNSALIAYLQERTEGQRYMVAVASAMIGSNLVLESNRGVMFMGGFNGGDQVATPESLTDLVKSGDLTYVLDTMGMLSLQQPEIGTWLAETCQSVTDIDLSDITAFPMPAPIAGMQTTLYECKL